MELKFKNGGVSIPNWLIVAGLLFADGIYANHCRKKTAEALINAEHKTEFVIEKEEKES